MTRWVYNPELDHFADDDGRPDMAPNQLNVALVQGRQLPAMDRKLFGGAATSDPRCRLALGPQRRATSTRLATLAPCWNEAFAMYCEDDGDVPRLASSKLPPARRQTRFSRS